MHRFIAVVVSSAFKNSLKDVRTKKCVFLRSRWWGEFLTPGYPVVRVRNVRGRSRPKSSCLFGSPKCREKENVKKICAEPLSERIFPNTVKHRKFPQTVSQNAPFCETVLICFFLFIFFLCFRFFFPENLGSHPPQTSRGSCGGEKRFDPTHPSPLSPHTTLVFSGIWA